MELVEASRMNHYLLWNQNRFGSDSITNSFRYSSMQPIISEYRKEFEDHGQFMEDYMRRMYTIGGMIIFPKPYKGENGRRTQTMNQARGSRVGPIRDRWDRTLECIRLYYLGKKSPLFDVIHDDSWFFDKFIDFQGYVDFFFLQDCVSSDYSEVIPWIGDVGFDTPALPRDVDEYRSWIQVSTSFVENRNKRIQGFIESYI
ncbi:MAG: hypothetical protein IKD00_06315 [Candidatus Methanomethylophilaceae archaeon]|nr:hypothetical protein [Candidatus Methanomethylophilaceae archaeon]